MQLRTARVCLDCEELHDAQTCPVCASEVFAFLTQWVPVEERRAEPRRGPRIQLPSRKQTLVFGGGLISLLAFWAYRWSARVENDALGRTGELR